MALQWVCSRGNGGPEKYVTCQDFTAKRSNRERECGSSDATSTSLSGAHTWHPMVAIISYRLPCLAIYLNKIYYACLPRREKQQPSAIEVMVQNLPDNGDFIRGQCMGAFVLVGEAGGKRLPSETALLSTHVDSCNSRTRKNCSPDVSFYRC